MTESRDWVGVAKLTGLQADAEYECELYQNLTLVAHNDLAYLDRLTDPDGLVWEQKILSFRTTPDARLVPGSHFRFVSTSCVVCIP